MVETDYTKLKPGLYLQVGERMTALKTYGTGVGTLGDLILRGTERNPSIETIAAEVGWVFVAISKRRQQITEVPYSWELNGNELDGETPWDMPCLELWQQIDESLQYYSTAYLLKQRQRGGMWGLRWMDPTTIQPDYRSATPADGIRQYIVTLDNGGQQYYPAADVIRFMRPGMRVLRPDTSAGQATTLAGSILRGIDQSSDVFYENNGLPVMLVNVPAGTTDIERERLADRFRRLFNARKGTQELRTIGVGEGVTATPLSFKPTDLAMTELEGQKVDLILAAHDVPKSIALADAANYATAMEAKRSFVSSMGARLTYMAEVFNRDVDFKAAGYKMIVRVGDHYSMKEDESQRAGAFRAYLMGFNPEAAAYLVGISRDDFPADIGEPFKTPEQIAAAANPFGQGGGNGGNGGNSDDRNSGAADNAPAATATATAKAAELPQGGETAREHLQKWCKKAVKRGPGRAVPFETDLIEPGRVSAIMGALEATRCDDDIRYVFDQALTWYGYP